MKRLLSLLVLAFALVGTSAWAIDLDSARQQGLVGERVDGLVGAVKDSPDVAALVKSVNDTRLSDYRAIAAREGTKLDAVQAIAGQKQIEKARANGWYHLDAGGAWKKG